MKYGFQYLIISSLAIMIAFSAFLGGGCVHDPFPELVTPIDTTMNPIDTMKIDTMPVDTMNVPCDTDIVYFSSEILPLLNSNCALSGCHNAASAQKDVVLTDYQNVINTADIKPFDLDDSKLYRFITETDEDKRMPPPPNAKLKATEIQLIAKWILQGATNDSCQSVAACDTINMSFSMDVSPILTENCTACHNTTGPSGQVALDTYQGVAAVASNGKLKGAITHAPGFEPMPQNLGMLPACDIDMIIAWINQGNKNN